MSLFSFLRKNKQESTSKESTFYSRAEEDSKAVRSRARRRGSKDGKGDEALDPVLPEKKRARRRLIGAVALVLAAVIGLPMVLDSEPKPLGDDIAIQIPSKDKPADAAITRSDRSEAPANSDVPAAASLDEKEEVVESPAAAMEPEKASPGKLSQTVETAASRARNEVRPDADLARNTGDKATSPASTVKAESKPEPKPVETNPKNDKADKVDEEARVRALLEGKPDPSKAEGKKPGKYVIQVAALATREKIDELQSKLKSAGIKSYTQKIATASGDRTRIRVGPFASKEEAEKVRARIVNLGLNGTLVPA